MAAITKLLWDLAHKADSLWVKWVHTYYFKNKPWWGMAIPMKCSWVLKRILKCRGLIDNIGNWDTLVQGNRFKIKKMYKAIMIQAPKVTWRRVICNNLATPKSLFLTWLAVKNRLLTKDRLQHWNIQCDPACFLCNQSLETVQHLFFACDYSRAIWSQILKLLGFQRSVGCFDVELDWISKKCRKTRVKSRLLAMCFAESVYHIWLQRNALIFTGNLKSTDVVFKDIMFSVACRCHVKDRHLLIL
ncbi:uncharacterized protein LOC110739906 [Chenopodium quinoa]|uniref:uncharacterized protein LOC110739906 n=1 Tax=Chenopodium quinoa TaxID=63459 RepID=UPI000B7902ED|nr:uncharacterized protein LOC110739906 [Chenopodium quinoa]